MLGGCGNAVAPFLSYSASADLVSGQWMEQRLLPEQDAPRGTKDYPPTGPVCLACSAEVKDTPGRLAGCIEELLAVRRQPRPGTG